MSASAAAGSRLVRPIALPQMSQMQQMHIQMQMQMQPQPRPQPQPPPQQQQQQQQQQAAGGGTPGQTQPPHSRSSTPTAARATPQAPAYKQPTRPGLALHRSDTLPRSFPRSCGSAASGSKRQRVQGGRASCYGGGGAPANLGLRAFGECLTALLESRGAAVRSVVGWSEDGTLLVVKRPGQALEAALALAFSDCAAFQPTTADFVRQLRYHGFEVVAAGGSPRQTSRLLGQPPAAAQPLLFCHARYVRGADLSELQANTFHSNTAGQHHAAMWNTLLVAASSMA